ncbi:MAG: DUF2017 domain-containing protein [Propionibacteriaceae bacterium]|jgi:hypothetical protein|nr:DUF2017 domain-containing protein [Propionibacteriaceae bacterium]
MKIFFSANEAGLLTNLTAQLGALVSSAGLPVDLDDEFAMWQAEMDHLEPLDHSDPAIARLFPAAYRNDLQASAAFASLTDSERRLEIIANAQRVIGALDEAAATARGSEYAIDIPNEDFEAWIKTLNLLRVVLATRLGIQTEADSEAFEHGELSPEEAYGYAIFVWLGEHLEWLLQ